MNSCHRKEDEAKKASNEQDDHYQENYNRVAIVAKDKGAVATASEAFLAYADVMVRIVEAISLGSWRRRTVVNGADTSGLVRRGVRPVANCPGRRRPRDDRAMGGHPCGWPTVVTQSGDQAGTTSRP